MLTGIYALCDLGGARLLQASATALGLETTGDPIAVQARDVAHTGGVHSCGNQSRRTVLLGFVEDLDDLAGQSDWIETAPLIANIQRMFDSLGSAIIDRLPGEWTLLDWQPGQLSLIQSRARLNWLFWARRGDVVWVSPDLMALSRIAEVGRELDETGMLLALGRGHLRQSRLGVSVLAGVRRLECGECVVLTRGGEAVEQVALLAEPARWQGGYGEAIEAAEALLLPSLRKHLARAGRAAVMLSGGLDSSTLAALLVEAAQTRDELFCVTSVAPSGSNLADEAREARLVADHLGLEQVLVTPRKDAAAYCPDPMAFLLAGGPSLSPRHYLYAELAQAAEQAGGRVLFDGAFGELSLTGAMPLGTFRHRLRMAARQIMHPAAPQSRSAFHVRLAQHRTDKLDPYWHASPPRLATMRRPDEPWGYFPGAEKCLYSPQQMSAGATAVAPFRDWRLLRLFAGFPASYLVRDGHHRAPARSMMRGRLPEEIRIRDDNGPFSPDYFVRLRDQAPQTLARLPAWRAAEVDDWLDLAWLEQKLGEMAGSTAPKIEHAFEVQLTAMVAEFIYWWRMS